MEYCVQKKLNDELEIYEVCPKSNRPWAGKKKFCIWVVTIPNPLQSRPLVTPHT
jgi:hypothetical protein